MTSNPTPDYIARVAGVFANNGTGVRGDLYATVAGHPARSRGASVATARRPTYGQLQGADDPLRPGAARVPGAGGVGQVPHHPRSRTTLGQAPFRSSSVFNFFSPNYRKPGTLASLGLYSPEFQIQTEQWVIAYSNTLRRVVSDGYGYDTDRLMLDLAPQIALAGNPPALVESLNTLLFSGMMSTDLRNIIVEAVESLPGDELEHRAQLAVSLAVTSAEFVVQK